MNGQRPDHIIIDEAVHVLIGNGNNEWEEIGTVNGTVTFDAIPDEELIEPRPPAYRQVGELISSISKDRIEWRRRAMIALTKVREMYPGPAGEILYREILSWIDQGGILFDKQPKLMTDLIAQILGELDA